MSKGQIVVVLTEAERAHLEMVLADAADRGDYYGNRDQYWKRHARIIGKLVLAQAPREAER